MKNGYQKTLKIILFSICLIIFFFAGRFLLIIQPPQQSDVIIILGGGNGERELEASNLFEKDYSNLVILSNGGTRDNPSTIKAKKEIQWLISDGVPEKSIIPELSSLSTYDNAVNTKRIMVKNHFKSAIVVSSSYHLRRAKYIFDKVYEDSGIKLNYQAANVKNYNPYLWWTTPVGWEYTTTEYIKFAGYYLFYGLLSKK